MMTAQERVASLHERMEALQRTKERQKTIGITLLCYDDMPVDAGFQRYITYCWNSRPLQWSSLDV